MLGLKQSLQKSIIIAIFIIITIKNTLSHTHSYTAYVYTYRERKKKSGVHFNLIYHEFITNLYKPTNLKISQKTGAYEI